MTLISWYNCTPFGLPTRWLGLVRIIGSWKKTNTTQIARNGSVKNEDSIEELPALEVVEKCDRAKITVNVTTI